MSKVSERKPGASKKAPEPALLSAKDKAVAAVALDTLHTPESELTPDFAIHRMSHASSAFELSPKDHVLLQSDTANIGHHVRVQDPRGAREEAAKVLSRLASSVGTTPGELGPAIAAQLSEELATASIDSRAAGFGQGLPLGREARTAWDALMGRIGQWEAKTFLSDLLQTAQLEAKLGDGKPVGSKHLLIVGDPGTGKTTFAPHLAPILHALGYTKDNKFHAVTGSHFHGVNSGEINKRVEETFKKAKDGVLFIDEIQSLTSQGKSSWSGSVYGAINAKLTDPAYRNTVVIFGGYPQAGEDLKDCDPGLARRLSDTNRIHLSRLNVGELVERFLQIADEQGLNVSPESIEQIRKLLARVSQTESFGNAGFVANMFDYCKTQMADRLARGQMPIGEVELRPEDIALPPGTYYPCAFLDGKAVTQEAVREQLSKNVVGQSAAIDAVAELLVARHHLPANTEASRKPVFRLHFMGSSASGKSLLAREAAKTFMSRDDLAANREPPIFELSANTIESFRRYLAGPERFSANTHSECPLLEWMKSTPGGVLVINEADKGPDDLMTTLMEIFDTGRYTPNSGREFDFSNYGVVLTSNFGNEIGLHNRKEEDDQSGGGPARDPRPGEVNGLVAHVAKDVQVGGAATCLVAVAEAGTGKVEIKSNAKQVMTESAEIALKYLRANAEDLGVAPELFKEHDFVIGMSSAAMPKDGPSAGITMATAMFSAVTGRTIPTNIAMTGELTLTGKVDPVGGIREKVLGAFEQGIDTIILSEQNRRDVEALPEALRGAMRFEFVTDLRDVLRVAFANRKDKGQSVELPPELYQEIAELRSEAYMKRQWPAEVLGRFDTDKPVLFRSLGKADIKEIIRLNARRQAEEDLREAGLELRVSGALEERLLARWDEQTGARPVLRALTREVIVPLLQGQRATSRFLPGTTVLADLVDGAVVFTAEKRIDPAEAEVHNWLEASRDYGIKAEAKPSIPEANERCDSKLLDEALDKDRTNEERLSSAVLYLNSGSRMSLEDGLDLLIGLPRGVDWGWEDVNPPGVASKRIILGVGLRSWAPAKFEPMDVSIVLATLDRVTKPLSVDQRRRLSVAARAILAASLGFKEKHPEYVGDCFSAIDRLLEAEGPVSPGPLKP